MDKVRRVPKFILVIGLLAALIAGIFYVYFNWRGYKEQVSKEAVENAEFIVPFLDASQIAALTGSVEDLNQTSYLELKEKLAAFKKQNTEIEYAYLMGQRDGRLYFLVDSELPGSDGYSPPGQAYTEQTEQDLKPFLSGEALLTTAKTDRWGTWVSTLVPVKDKLSGRTVAVFGVDYPAKEWNATINHHLIDDIAMVVCILLMLGGIYRLYSSILKTRELSNKLKESESLARTIFEQAPVGIALVRGDDVISVVNKEYHRILGRSKEEVTSMKWADITHPDDLGEDLEQFALFKAGRIPGYSMEKRYLRPDGTYIWVQMNIAGISVEGGEPENKDHLCLLMDIQDRKIAEETLRESERNKEVLLSHMPGLAYRCVYDENWTMLYLSAGCFELTGYAPEDFIGNSRLSFNDIICEEYRESLQDEWARIIEQKTDFKHEYEIMTAPGVRRWVIEMGQPVFNAHGEVDTLEGIIIDITDTKQATEKIQYMADHDHLTEVYNRKYFEEAKSRLDKSGAIPAAVVKADINGMRLINDAFGQAEGDVLLKITAELIERCCGEDVVLARTGGDEFSILAPGMDAAAADRLVRRIKDDCEACNALNLKPGVVLNLSIGYGIRQTPEQTLDAAEREAEEFLNRHKIFERKSHHNTILSSIMATMYARSFETEEHAERLAKLSKTIGEKMNLNQKSLVDLELLSILHDIGKMGVDDRILNKPGPLTTEEWSEMKKHPEIGYRIALSAPEFESVAEYILCHHERWDGGGYPQGLRGEEIPLLSRIISVADAYDAMTEDRVYRKGLPHETALEEIKNNAGMQFDPYIAEIFICTAVSLEREN